MTADQPTERQLAKELQFLCANIGYRSGTNGTEAIREVPTLIGLVIVGGPSVPDGILEWRDRRERLRAVLQDVIENEVKKELDERYADAAIRIFRLNASRPLDVPDHVALGEIQAPLDEAFGSPRGSKAFQDDHRPLIFAVMARALATRERKATKSSAARTAKAKPSTKKRSQRKRSESGSKSAVTTSRKQSQQAAPAKRPTPSSVSPAPRVSASRVSPRRRAVMEKGEAERRAAKARAKEERAWLKWPLLAVATVLVVFLVLLAVGVFA